MLAYFMIILNCKKPVLLPKKKLQGKTNWGNNLGQNKLLPSCQISFNSD